MVTIDTNFMIQKPNSKVFRRFFIKRRQTSDGQFESTWQDMTEYVKRWGKYSWTLDTPRYGELRFDNTAIQVVNIDGSFNKNTNEDSFWFGYGDIQRSLVKIESGFIHQTLSAGGIWTNTEYPTTTSLWRGIINGDIFSAGRGELNIPLKPVMQIFRDFPANQITGFTSTGISAGGWFAMLRDQTDGGGNFVFRPFIGEGTSTDWNIATGSSLYANLNTSSAEDLRGFSCWNVIERLASAENSLAFINREGKLYWQNKDPTGSVQYQFHGLGSQDRTYGQTIKRINYYGPRLTAFYSRVSVKYVDADTTTSFVNTALAFAINGTNTAWNLGQRTFSVENFWLANSAAAATVAGRVFDEVSSQSEEISFDTTLITNLSLLDRVSVTYDATDFVTSRSLWDINDWASDVTSTTFDLIWDASRGDSIILDEQEFKILSISVDLDKMETNFVAKQI